jgi:hypothetical protein
MVKLQGSSQGTASLPGCISHSIILENFYTTEVIVGLQTEACGPACAQESTT